MNQMVFTAGLLGLLAGCAPTRPQTATPAVPPSPIDTTAIRGYTRFLSDDALAGRMTGTREADLSALYIASACIGIGFSPVGTSYLQPVRLDQATILGDETELRLSGPKGVRTYRFQSDFIPNLTVDRFAGFAGPTVYVGTAEEVAAGGIGTIDMSGAVAVLVGPVIDPADDTLRARRVIGTIQLTGDEAQYRLYVRSRGGSRLRLADSTIKRSFSEGLASIVASPQLSRNLVGETSLARGAVRLADSVAVHIGLGRKPVVSSNVACLLEGADPKVKDTAIVFGAHYDHLGIGIPDARGDSIYNGFSDDAAGVAMLLAIGSALNRRPLDRPRHSILLLFFTGEEQGLLGSDYYAAHPLWPLGRVRGMINLDAGAPPGRPWSWRIARGNGNSTLGRLAQDVAADHGWSATTSPATPNTDYFPFVRSGVPGIFIVPGSAPYQGLSADSSQALRRRWDHYHEPGDEWAPDFPFSGLGRYAEYAYLIGRALDGPLAGRNRALPPQ
ncbi:MAG: M28 family peptidase [Gemmatimonadetes bacterium]|nr:M28 family peptidase [Gemmatimonadota bacterium]